MSEEHEKKVPTEIIGYERKGGQRLPIHKRLVEPSWADPKSRDWKS